MFCCSRSCRSPKAWDDTARLAGASREKFRNAASRGHWSGCHGHGSRVMLEHASWHKFTNEKPLFSHSFPRVFPFFYGFSYGSSIHIDTYRYLARLVNGRTDPDPTSKMQIRTIFQAIFCWNIPLHMPYIGLIHGRYLQFRFLKWQLNWWLQRSTNGNVPLINAWV